MCNPDLASQHPLMPFWAELDRLLMQNVDELCRGMPWDAVCPRVRAAWARLTAPAHLVALEDWARNTDAMNDFAKDATLRALADCRARVVQEIA